jgi:hypothetical protein
MAVGLADDLILGVRLPLFERTDWEDQQRGRKKRKKERKGVFASSTVSHLQHTIPDISTFSPDGSAGFYVGEYVTLLRDTTIGRGSDI